MEVWFHDFFDANVVIKNNSNDYHFQPLYLNKNIYPF